MFSKKATKIDEIFTVDLTLFSNCQNCENSFLMFFSKKKIKNEFSQYLGQSTVKILSIFSAFLENTNFL